MPCALNDTGSSVFSLVAVMSPPSRAPKNSDGNFVKINLKKKSHVKGFALRGAALRKQVSRGHRPGGWPDHLVDQTESSLRAVLDLLQSVVVPAQKACSDSV